MQFPKHLVSLFLLSACAGAFGQSGVQVYPSVQQDISAPLRSLGNVDDDAPKHEHHKVKPVSKKSGPVTSPATASATTSTFAPPTATSFEGLGQGVYGFTVKSAPPDPNGSVGLTQYMQWVNTSIAVFDKATGALTYGPSAGNTIWKGFGGGCETNNDGDPVIQYDKAANRWILSQFSVATAPYYHCVAISTTSDATGSYYRYAFQMPNFPDYPKLGVWPDAYYASTNSFNGSAFLGGQACAFDRAKMLTGAPATAQCFQLPSTSGSILPADLDGATPPPANSPGYFFDFGTDSLLIYKLHVDFTTPANSTFTGPVSLPVAPFSPACNGGGTCIPQPGTTQQLDSLADRIMYRAAYRNYGDHEAVALTHSISAGTSVGMRWYELRNLSTTPTVYQQGTHAPDAQYRWMGSVAMDKAGNLALGYSVSSGTVYPSIRYTGRLASDPLGALEAEVAMASGTGSQTTLSRWGDYSSLSVDPVDDCTFWYTNEYLRTTGSFNWNTRIASFKFPGCGSTTPTSDFTISATPATQTITAGASTTYTVTTAVSSGSSSSVNLSVTGLPAGVSGSFNPATVTSGGGSTLTITTLTSTAAGTYPLTIAGAGANKTHSASTSLTVNAAVLGNSATFIKADTTSQGNWKSAYGSDGCIIVHDATIIPAYAQVVLANESAYTWNADTTDIRALQKGTTPGRIASTWFSYSYFTIDINLTDGKSHQITLYGLDWDAVGRAESIEVLDVNTLGVLDTRSLSAFAGGQYVSWNVSGHVRFRIARTAGTNAVISGLFFGAGGTAPAPDFSVSATPPAQSVAPGTAATYNVTVTALNGFSSAVSLTLTGAPAGSSASFNPSLISGAGSSVLTLTTSPSVTAGTYPLAITASTGSLSHSYSVNLTIVSAGGGANSATFVNNDTGTQGNWKSMYGNDGYAVVQDGTLFPAYATVTLASQDSYTWNGNTTDIRALQHAGASGRIASTWFASRFTIDVNLTDGLSHQLALYCLDWDYGGRVETIDVLDSVSGAVLDSRSVSAFAAGQYLVWNLTGHVQFRITKNAGSNAVVSGLFFAGAVSPGFTLSATPPSQTAVSGAQANYTATVTATNGFTGSVALRVQGLPTGAVGTFNPTTVNGSGSSNLSVVTASGTAAGNYPLTITAASGALTRSVIVTLAVGVSASSSAAFVTFDTASQGNWKTLYGTDGYNVVNDTTSYPAYAQVTTAGASALTWASATTDVRALQRAGSGRIAATLYASNYFTVDVNLTDGASHKVSIYFLDWDNLGVSETVDMLDPVSGALLDRRLVSGFSGGAYLTWNLSGHVIVRFTQTGPAYAALSGLFFK